MMRTATMDMRPADLRIPNGIIGAGGSVSHNRYLELGHVGNCPLTSPLHRDVHDGTASPQSGRENLLQPPAIGIEVPTRCIVLTDPTDNARLQAKDSGGTYAL